MYYIIERIYVGPNRDENRYVDFDNIEIRTVPAITNCSHEERTEGWCGTTGDFAVYAHGEYATIEEARAAVAKKFGEVRDFDTGDKCESVAEIYKPGKYAPMSRPATVEFSYEAICRCIKADTTDERIVELVAEWEAEANEHAGCTLHGSLKDFMHEYRQQLRDELDDDDEMESDF